MFNCDNKQIYDIVVRDIILSAYQSYISIFNFELTSDIYKILINYFENNDKFKIEQRKSYTFSKLRNDRTGKCIDIIKNTNWRKEESFIEYIFSENKVINFYNKCYFLNSREGIKIFYSESHSSKFMDKKLSGKLVM